MSNITMDTLKIKKMFSYLQNKKIDQVQKIINGGDSKPKLHINMTTKSPFQKQVIVPMNNKMVKRYLKNSSMYIININCALKNIKSNIIANFICIKDKGIVITINNVASFSDLQEIEKCVKSLLITDIDQISSPRLLQSKSYLKIVGIPYLSEQLNPCISSNNIEKILKNNYIFNDIVLTSRLRVIKVLLKLDMTIIWIDIWDIQNGSKAKIIINRYFNVGSFIATVCRANMNPGVLQCKNCWKWEHTASVCYIQGAKYVKCNGPHQTIHHCQFA